jgi:large subunit ribosomal protein L7/L12
MAEETKKPSTAEATAGKDEQIEVPAKFKKLVEEIEKMSVLDLAELVKILEKKFGVSASAPVVMQGAPAAGAAPAVEEKSTFTIMLNTAGDKKIEVIKVVRDVLGKGLKEAKDLVDATANGPQLVKENAKKEEAEDIKKKLEVAGAKVELK